MANSIIQCYVCNFCDIKFKNSNDLDLHKQLHTSSGEFSCPLCRETFVDLTELQLHDLQHSLEEIKNEKTGLSPINITCIPPASSFACKICYKVFLSDEELFDHISQHAYTGTIIDKSISKFLEEYGTKDFDPPVTYKVTKRTYHKRNKSDCDGPYECNTCKTVYNHRYALRRHQRRFHSDKSKFVCTVCPETFINLSSLCEHSLQHFKTKEQEFECYICKKLFSSSMLLLEHIFVTHVCQSKNFCRACFTFFPDKDLLHRHMEDHVSAYNCKKCKKWYQTKSKLIKHKCVVDGPKPYICKICGKQFRRLYHLQRHCYIHEKEEGFSKMLGVDSEFFQKQSIEDKLHSVNDTEEVLIDFKKKFECYMCNTQWYSLINYKEHFLSDHKDVEFNSCPVCFKKFSKSSRVKRHLALHSKEGSISIKSSQEEPQ